MYHPTQAASHPPRAPTEPEGGRSRGRLWSILAILAAGLLLLAVLQAANGVFGLFDGIPSYEATYHDDEWRLTVHPPRPYVVKEDEEGFGQRVLIVFDPDTWDGHDPDWSSLLVYAGPPDDYRQPTMADVNDWGDEWVEDVIADLRIRPSVSQIEVRATRARTVGGTPALEVLLWYQHETRGTVWEQRTAVYMNDRPLFIRIRSNSTSGPGGLDALDALLETVEFDEPQR